jgi:hypothetical protein
MDDWVIFYVQNFAFILLALFIILFLHEILHGVALRIRGYHVVSLSVGLIIWGVCNFPIIKNFKDVFYSYLIPPTILSIAILFGLPHPLNMFLFTAHLFGMAGDIYFTIKAFRLRNSFDKFQLDVMKLDAKVLFKHHMLTITFPLNRHYSDYSLNLMINPFIWKARRPFQLKLLS